MQVMLPLMYFNNYKKLVPLLVTIVGRFNAQRRYGFSKISPNPASEMGIRRPFRLSAVIIPRPNIEGRTDTQQGTPMAFPRPASTPLSPLLHQIGGRITAGRDGEDPVPPVPSAPEICLTTPS